MEGYISVIRLANQIQQGDYNVLFAVENRNGTKSELGYTTSLAFYDNSMKISYTDVGDYQSISFTFQASF